MNFFPVLFGSSLLLLVTLVVISSGQVINFGPLQVDLSTLTDENLFEDYMKHFKLDYSPAEAARRLAIFRTNLVEIKKNPNFGITQFADWTPQEFKSQMLTLKPTMQQPSAPALGFPFIDIFIEGIKWFWSLFVPTNKCRPNTCPGLSGRIEKNKNLHEESNDLTPILNQGKCGSCYAHTYATVLRDTWVLTYKQPSKLPAIQQIVDCSGGQGNQGCNGGLMSTTHKYIQDEGGINLDSDYRAYNAEKGSCTPNKEKYAYKSIGVYKELECNEDNLKKMLDLNRPVAVAVDATEWQHYTGNIITGKDCCMKQLNHAVVLVGYGEENGVCYWLIQNSWSTAWGEKGFIRIQCGINCFGVAYMAGVIDRDKSLNDNLKTSPSFLGNSSSIKDVENIV